MRHATYDEPLGRGHLGPGLVAKGPADAAGTEPLIHLVHEPAGIITLEVRWQTLLCQMRFDLERLRYLSLEEHEGAAPPYAQALYSYRRGEEEFRRAHAARPRRGALLPE